MPGAIWYGRVDLLFSGPGRRLLLSSPEKPGRRFNRVQAMIHKAVAQRDVEYLNELLSKETDENRRTILLRLLTDAKEKLRQAEEQEEKD